MICYSSGGLFAGKILSENDEIEQGGRFDEKTVIGQLYRERYFRSTYFSALKEIKAAAVSASLCRGSIVSLFCSSL